MNPYSNMGYPINTPVRALRLYQPLLRLKVAIF